MNDGAGPDRRVIWLLLGIGCLSGLSTYLVTPLEQPDQLMLASDVYRHAVRSWLTGDGLYGLSPAGRDGYTYLYPPVTVPVFLPHAIVPSGIAAYGLQVLGNIAAALAIVCLLVRGLHRRNVDVGRVDGIALVAFMLLSSYSAIQLLNGQITLWLGLAVAAGLHWLDRDQGRLAGLAFAIAALFKVFPAVLGLLLVRRRTWRGVWTAVAAGLAGLVLGAVLLGPGLTETYLLEVLPGRFSGSTYAGRPDPTDNVDGIHRQLAALHPGTDDLLRTILAVVLIAPLTGLSLRRVDTPVGRDAAALGIVVSILLFLPLQPLYFPLLVFPLVMLLYTVPPGPERSLLLLGTLLSLVHVDQESLVLTFDVLDAPESLVAAVVAMTEPLFTFILPPTLGLWLMLLACGLIQISSPAALDGNDSRGASP